MTKLEGESFSKRLKNAREKRKLTQLEFSKKLGIPRSTYAGYESGAREPELVTLIDISEILLFSLDDLIKGNKNKSKSIKNNQKEETLETVISLLFKLKENCKGA